MTCKNCIHYVVCYRKDTVPTEYASKCGDYISDRVIDDIKAEIASEITGLLEDSDKDYWLNSCLECIDKHIGERSDKE